MIGCKRRIFSERELARFHDVVDFSGSAVSSNVVGGKVIISVERIAGYSVKSCMVVFRSDDTPRNKKTNTFN